MFGFDDILIGAGIGALGSALFGGNPLQGAALGGVSGGLLGGMPAGSWAGGGAKALSATPTGMGINLAPIAAEAPLSFSLAPQVAQGAGINLGGSLTASSLPYSGFLGSTGELGANMAFAPSYTIGMTPSVDMAGKGMIDNLSQYATGTGYDLLSKSPSMLDKLKPYANIQNLSGAKSVYDMYNKPMQYPQVPQGRVTEGKAPQGSDVMNLIKAIQVPEKKRISLL
jgi:hypothetical protein